MIKRQPCKSLGIVFQEEGTGCTKAWREESLAKGEKKALVAGLGWIEKEKRGKGLQLGKHEVLKTL